MQFYSAIKRVLNAKKGRGLWTVGIEEREGVTGVIQAKGIQNIFNKTIEVVSQIKRKKWLYIVHLFCRPSKPSLFKGKPAFQNVHLMCQEQMSTQVLHFRRKHGHAGIRNNGTLKNRAWEPWSISPPPQEQIRDQQTPGIEYFYLNFSNLTASQRNLVNAELLDSSQSLFFNFWPHPSLRHLRPQRDFTFERMLASLSALMMLLLSSAVVG